MNSNQAERPLPFDMDEPMIWTIGEVSKAAHESTGEPRKGGLISWMLRAMLRIFGGR